MKTQPVTLPLFEQQLFHEHASCPRCRTKIGELDVRFAGAGRANDGSVCFSYQYECPACRKVYAVTNRIRAFSQSDWWNELAQWHDRIVHERLLPRIGPMVLDLIGLESIWIRGGYKGAVGPVMLVYSNGKSDPVQGVLRLERQSGVSLFECDNPHDLSRSVLCRFAVAAEGTSFQMDGRKWMRMTASEIKEIIRDRVFTLRTDDADQVTTPEPKSRRGHGSTNAKKSSKRTRRPPRNSRPLDS